MSKKKRNPVKLRADSSIGNISAEADDFFLFNCFVDHPALSAISDMDSSRMFLAGRTGAGKTAFIRKIESANRHVSVIDLHDMAMDYVANSDIIRFLESLEIDMDMFFQALWKHVLCIEFVRMRYSIKDKSSSKTIFASICDFFKNDERKQKGIKYLTDWENNFWITMDENIKDVTNSLENKIEAEFSAEIAKFKTRAGYTRTLSNEKKTNLTMRVKKIVNEKQLHDLGHVLNLLSEFSDKDYMGNHYILIDRIDEKWVDESIRFKLIRALIECLRSFRKIHCLKIIVSIRSDVLERVVLETQDIGFQREKYDDYFLNIIWKKDDLNSLVQKRIEYLFRKTYTSENVFFDDIFPHKINNKWPLDYILERTLYRPRDVIAFVNLCLQEAQGEYEVRPTHIRSAEAEYSRIRRHALLQEWESAFPSLEVAFDLLSGKRDRFDLSEIATQEFVEDFIIRAAEVTDNEFDQLHMLSKAYMKDHRISSILDVARAIIRELYRIGAVGVKLSSSEKFIYSYKDIPILDSSNLGASCRIHIHPMLHRALNIERVLH